VSDCQNDFICEALDNPHGQYIGSEPVCRLLSGDIRSCHQVLESDAFDRQADRMLVWLYAKRSHHGQENRAVVFCFCMKHLDFRLKFNGVGLADGVRFRAELGLHKVEALIGPVNQQIDLSTWDRLSGAIVCRRYRAIV
jgi:hypothetical protein